MRVAPGKRLLAGLAVAALVFGSTLILAFRAEQRQRLESEGDLRRSSWTAFQAERELLRLLNVLHDRAARSGQAAGDAHRQFELLMSRVDLLVGGEESRAIWSDRRLNRLASEVRSELASLEPVILALAPGDLDGLARIEPKLDAIGAGLRDIVQEVTVGERAFARPAALGPFWAFAGFVACMLTAVAALVGLLLRELRARSALLARAVDAEAAAVKARERLVDAIEAADDAFALFDADDRLVLCNSKFRETYALSADAIVEGARFENIIRVGVTRGQHDIPPGSEEDWVQQRLAAHRQPREPMVVQLSDGRWLRISERPTRDGGIVGFRTDITALKRRELELAALARAHEEARQQLAEAIEAFPGSFVLHDAAERIVLWNSKRETFYGDQRGVLYKGIAAEELLRRCFALGHYPWAVGREEEAVAEMLAWHRSPGSAKEIRTADGRWVRLENRKTAMGGVVAVGFDVTEAKERERQFAQAQKMKAVGQLTGGVAHDFNNLLQVIKGNADWALQTLPAGASERNALTAIRTAGERGAALVRRLLAFSRQQQLAPEPLEINDRLVGLARMLQRTLGEQIEIRTSFAESAATVRVDPAQFDSALLNLAINARDAMPNGGVLTLRTAEGWLDPTEAQRLDVEPGRYVRVTVADDGVGMPAHVAERAFEPFFTTKEVGKGTGLGLSMVYGVLRQSGGAAEIRSAPGEGCAIDLYLPACATPAALPARPGPPPPAAQAQPPRGVERVLVVEDDEAVRELVTMLLDGLGYQVIAAANGRDALETLERDGAVDLLLTDLVMPGGLGGRELADRARRIRPGLRVLYTSGYSAETATPGPDSAFARRLLRKPYMRADLARAVRAALDEPTQSAA